MPQEYAQRGVNRYRPQSRDERPGESRWGELLNRRFGVGDRIKWLSRFVAGVAKAVGPLGVSF